MSGSILAILVVIVVIVLLLAMNRVGRVISDPAYYARALEAADGVRGAGRADDARQRYGRIVRNLHRVSTPSGELQQALGRGALALGELEQAAGKTALALTAFQEAIRYVSLPAPTVALVATSYALAGSFTGDAIRAYALHVTTTRGRRDLGDAAMAAIKRLCDGDQPTTNERATAIASLARDLINADNELAWAHLALGRSLTVLGQDEAAITALEDADRLAPNASTPLLVAQLYTRFGRTEAAYVAFRRSLEREPRQPEVLYKAAVILVARAQGGDQAALNEARGYLTLATTLAPTNAETWHLLGTAERQRGKATVSQHAFAKAASLMPNNRGFQMDLATVSIECRDVNAAKAALLQAIQAEETYAPAHHLLADLSLEYRQFDNAVTHYQRALDLRPGNQDIRVGLGRALYGGGRYAKAINALTAVPQLPQVALIALGRSYGKTGATTKAIAVFQRAIAESGPSGGACYFLACSLARQGDWRAAVTAFDQAGLGGDEVPPSDLLFYRGVALAQVDRYAEARAAYLVAAELAPGNSSIYYSLGTLAARQGQIEDAEAHFRKALVLEPTLAGAHFGLGMVLEQRGANADAAGSFQAGLAYQPDWTPARLRLGVLQARLADWPAALAALQAAAQQGEQSDDLYFYLGLAFAMSGQHDASIRWWEPLRERHPDDVVIQSNLAASRYMLGLQRFDAGGYDDAIAHWEEGERLRPDVAAFRRAQVQAHMRLAYMHMHAVSPTAQQLASAETALRRAARLDPEDLRPPYFLGILALSNGDHAAARALLSPLVQRFPMEPRYAYALALTLLATGDATTASQHLQSLIPLDLSAEPGFCLALGNAALLQGRWEDAADAFCQVLGLTYHQQEGPLRASA